MCRNTELVPYVDIQGSCCIYREGFSTACFYSYTVAKALNEVGRSLYCRVYVSKITWCSDKGSVAADTLSEADFLLFMSIMQEHNKFMCEAPKTIRRWLSDPKVDMELGHKILCEMSEQHRMLGYNI